jgi:hypothetical protein
MTQMVNIEDNDFLEIYMGARRGQHWQQPTRTVDITDTIVKLNNLVISRGIIDPFTGLARHNPSTNTGTLTLSCTFAWISPLRFHRHYSGDNRFMRE